MIVYFVAVFIYTVLNVSAHNTDLTSDLRGFSRRLDSKDKNKICNEDYAAHTVKEVLTIPFAGIYSFSNKMVNYEVSDVTIGDAGEILAICDNSWDVFGITGSILSKDFPHKSIRKPYEQYESKKRRSGSPDWETLVYIPEKKEFLAVRESPTKKRDEYSPEFITLELDGDEWVEKETCTSDVTFDTSNKGIEGGIHMFSKRKEKEYFLGLCETNHCESGTSGDDKGHGKMILMEKKGKGSNCKWDKIGTVDIPKSADFKDYSSVAVLNERVAVLSQEDSAVWIGTLEGVTVDEDERTMYLYDEKKLKFDERDYHLLWFPRDHECDAKFCSLEGIEFYGENLLIAVSDAMKPSYGFKCREKDQSISLFALPPKIKI